MTSKELTELIRQNTRIILPNFGAFLVKDGGDKGFLPSNVSFSPFLRYNDGMIEVHVAKSRGISKEEASKVLFDFIENIKNELLEKGSYEVEGLGFLKRDQRGSLTFVISEGQAKKEFKADVIVDTQKKEEPPISVDTAEKNEAISADEVNSKKMSKAKPKAKVEKLVSKKAPKSKNKEIEPEVKNENSTSQEYLIAKNTEATFVLDGEPEKATEPIIEPVNEKTTSEKLIEIEKMEPLQDKKPEPELKQKKNLNEDYSVNIVTEEKKSSNKGFKSLIYTIIGIGVLLGIFFLIKSYYFAPNVNTIKEDEIVKQVPESIIKENQEVKDKIEKPKDDIDKSFNEQTEYDKFVAEQKEKEKKQEEAVANSLIENAKEKEKIKQNTTNTGGVKYYVIAGSFKSTDNAKKFATELKKSGFDAAIVIQPSGMNAVHIGSYSTHEAATKAMNEFKLKLKNLWVLKK